MSYKEVGKIGQPRVRLAIKNLLFTNIETKELLFVFLTFCDAKLTSICLSYGGVEATPWMRGWGDDVLARTLVAVGIILYLKFRGITNILWFGIIVLSFIVLWNCFMFMIILAN